MNNINNIEEINLLRKRKNAVILAHYYQIPEVQDIADFVGDSLALSQQAEKSNASIIVFAGVNFMAETAKIINKNCKVLIPDPEAGCSLADSCPDDEFEKFIKNNPGHKVISYINCSAKVKALSDVICTSSNAVGIVQSFNKDEKLIFAPDKNLGNYINSLTGRNMLLWNGACHVHELFSLEKIIELKKQNADAKIIAHPECKKQILIVSDYIGSTLELLKYVKKDSSKKYIVATESGILHQMKIENPEKIFIPAPPNDSTCACNDCEFMKKITVKKIYESLRDEKFEITLDENLRAKAEKPLRRMLELSEKLK
jgi:quinolinate synthase